MLPGRLCCLAQRNGSSHAIEDGKALRDDTRIASRQPGPGSDTAMALLPPARAAGLCSTFRSCGGRCVRLPGRWRNRGIEPALASRNEDRQQRDRKWLSRAIEQDASRRASTPRQSWMTELSSKNGLELWHGISGQPSNDTPIRRLQSPLVWPLQWARCGNSVRAGDPTPVSTLGERNCPSFQVARICCATGAKLLPGSSARSEPARIRSVSARSRPPPLPRAARWAKTEVRSGPPAGQADSCARGCARL